MATLPTVQDALHIPAPDAVQLHGLIGGRFHGSRMNRLRRQEDDHLLWPFQEGCKVGRFSPIEQQYPGIRGDWQGEFLGTWLDAASIATWNAADGELRTKIDNLVDAWLATQQPDGYLGTYAAADRWKSWDIWVQAHNLYGLFSYHRLSGRKDVLEAAKKIGYRFLEDFGPGKRTLRDTGWHMGMSSSAILEPLVWLFWETGDPAFLDFCRWLVEEDWEGEGGPRVLTALLAGKGVAEVGNAKGIEMMLDFAGLLELHRATGEEKYLRAILAAWEDIARHHLYLTGSASTGEYFPKDFVLRNEGIYMIGETCVSMGWMYLNYSLARLTGDARYLDMAEQTLYNHFLAAQSPDGERWAYYVGLRDSKRYRWHTDPECCPTKGVRGLALTLPHFFAETEDGLTVNFYERGEAVLNTPGGQRARLTVETAYPFAGEVRIGLDLPSPERFTLRLRLPGWCREYSLKVNGEVWELSADEKGYLGLARDWKAGDLVDFRMEMPVTVVSDALGNANKVALLCGPLVFAADQALLPPGMLLDDLVLALDGREPGKGVSLVAAEGSVRLRVPTRTRVPALAEGFWNERQRYRQALLGEAEYRDGFIELVPFLEAGNASLQTVEGIQPNDEAVRSISFQVWLPYTLR